MQERPPSSPKRSLNKRPRTKSQAECGLGRAMHSYNLLSALQLGTNTQLWTSQSQSNHQKHTGSYWRKAVRSPTQALLPPFHGYWIKSGCLPPAEPDPYSCGHLPSSSNPICPSPRLALWGFLSQNCHCRACNSAGLLWWCFKIHPVSRCREYTGT